MQQDLMKKLYFGYSTKDQSSYKYFNRGVWELPENFTSKIGKPVSTSQSLDDKYLRKFEYGKALRVVV